MSKQKSKLKSSGQEIPKHVYTMAFGKDNYRWMLIGLGIIILGFILMAGKTDDLFNNGEIFRGGSVSFSTTVKITIAPIVVLFGFIVEMYAILKKPATSNEPA